MIPSDVASPFLASESEPFVDHARGRREVPKEIWLFSEIREVLVAPLHWEPDGFGAIVMGAKADDARFTEQDLRLARGIADITSLALGNARRLSELERFHELVESLDAVFWEADAASLGLHIPGRTGRASSSGASVRIVDRGGSPVGRPAIAEDRDGAIAGCAASLRTPARTRTSSIGSPTPDGGTVWIRDMVHVVRGCAGPATAPRADGGHHRAQARRAGAATSERKYSEAFRREREAAQRLRALDEMKNTFLEAVSHDLRTPLTSILGSALTLEQTKLELPREDALDLVGRIAANARKLERLLSDLLDLDRLQRGIVAPQRRPTDLAELVARSVDEHRGPGDRDIEVGGRSVTVSVDAAKVERIVENLLSNAIRHTPDGTRIWVRGFGQDGGVMLVVEDEGIGDAGGAARGGVRAVPPGAGLLVGALPGRRRRVVAGATVRRAARRARLARGPRRRRRVVPRVPAWRLAVPDFVLDQSPPDGTVVRVELAFAPDDLGFIADPYPVYAELRARHADLVRRGHRPLARLPLRPT